MSCGIKYDLDVLVLFNSLAICFHVVNNAINRRHGSLQSGEKMKKMYVVSSLMLSLGIFLANGCSDEEATPTPASEDAGKKDDGKGNKGDEEPAMVPGHKWSQINVSGIPATGVEQAAVLENEDVITGTANGSDSFAIKAKAPSDKKDTSSKFWVISGKNEVVFGIDEKFHGRTKPEMANAPAEVKDKLPRLFLIGEIGHYKNSAGEEVFAVEIKDNTSFTAVSDATAVWVVDPKTRSFTKVVDGEGTVIKSLANMSNAGYTKSDVDNMVEGKINSVTVPMSTYQKMADERGISEVDPEAKVSVRGSKNQYVLVNLNSVWNRNAEPVAPKAK